MRFLAALIIILTSITVKAQSTVQTEFFIKVNEPGKVQISINLDYSYSSSGFYRFYDVKPGRTTVTITHGGKVYKKNLTLKDGFRSIAVFSKIEGLKIIDELIIYQNGAYSLDNWNSQIQTPSKKPIEKQYTNNHNREMPKGDFNLLLESYDKISFDDERIKFLSMALKNNRVSVEQLMILLKKINFDDARLSAAIINHNNVFDREKYYLVRNLFAFPASKEKLDFFLAKQDY